MLKVGQSIEVVNESIKAELSFGEMIFGNGSIDLRGQLVAVSPSLEEFAQLDENFGALVAHSAISQSELNDMVVYYDSAAGRNFVVEVNDVQLEGGVQ